MMNAFVDGVVSSTDIFVKSFFWMLGLAFFAVVFWWFYLILTLVSGFLKIGKGVISGQFVNGNTTPPFYRITEIKGSYKGREAYLGVMFAGYKNEFMPLPHIRLKLKETVGYNLNRVPDYAVIEKYYLVYKVKFSALWGVFDKNYPSLFSKNYLIDALEKLLSSAEDVERGRDQQRILQ